MSDERINIGPDEDIQIEQVWVGNQPIGKIVHRLNERVRKLENKNEELRQENERLTERVAELETNVDPDPTAKDYDEMDRSERVRKLRECLVEQAQRSHGGKAQMRYKEVQALFDNRPSASYAYKLMRIAAEEDGFNYVDKNGKAIRANTNAVKDETLFYGANKAYSTGAD